MKKSDEKIVLIVHSIDTEGPLYESLSAKFERLETLFGISHIPPTQANFIKLQNGEIDLGGIETKVAEVFAPHLVRYNDTWDKIDAMLTHVMSESFRFKLPDSYGNGWIYNWHCMDHVGYEENPRRRDMGYHNIFDHYQAVLSDIPDCPDRIHWHFHPMSTYKQAHRCATSYINSPELYQILTRRILQRNWFPTVSRAGFNAERPDSHWFLEQWIPFDMSNMALGATDGCNRETYRNTMLGDWRRAPSDWSVYCPDHDDYQTPGHCRRHIARILTALGRRPGWTQEEMDKAFARADHGVPTLVGIASHDHRDFTPEVDLLRSLIENAVRRFPNVKFRYCEAIDAFRRVIWPDQRSFKTLEFELILHPAKGDEIPFLEVSTRSGTVFGPQPFLAIQTKGNRFIHDNFDFSTEPGRWFYPFNANTLPLSDIQKVGVAANDPYGNICVKYVEIRR